ncbi:DnaJ-like protein subfamily B member 13 [Nymphaea thermarum]|nr:uncharacterized protein LOC116245345 [Nymphaea colorata]XP_031472828.1 uncharacterized protein LOC116245345 [Nymphaea colorata]KAF3776197.1 DnaJ-like protein subfamily B member 13 [Nymphaea thermarum]
MNGFEYRGIGGEAASNEATTSNSGMPSPSNVYRHQSADSAFARHISSRVKSTFIIKAPPTERKLECTLEELCQGCVKNILIAREVTGMNGKTVLEQEKLKIKVKPGWRTGTKITFECLGDERPGMLPADLVFLIVEKHHPLFRRDGNDLILVIEVPLVKALTGCTLSIPLLGGEKMCLALSDVIYPGYEKIIKGQGMPDIKEQGKKGDLRVQFQVKFPAHLSKKQQDDIRELFKDMPTS